MWDSSCIRSSRVRTMLAYPPWNGSPWTSLASSSAGTHSLHTVIAAAFTIGNHPSEGCICNWTGAERTELQVRLHEREAWVAEEERRGVGEELRRRIRRRWQRTCSGGRRHTTPCPGGACTTRRRRSWPIVHTPSPAPACMQMHRL